ncbi:sensor histidine kinase [Pseudomonas lopnurensis]|uniref:sensor histidine kinase n=1 Tax=Pseudomonas lopnurensis TaxID=1477517 RepID=UPI001878FFC5|nr:ATP-binding protein [Pseudomonas lopnurensis]MBE7373699.1 histidine kinase [Pseudomonas lopnurensis]
MPPQTTLRNTLASWPWSWPWLRDRDAASGERLLRELPLRLLRQPGSDEPLLKMLAALQRELCAHQASLLLPGEGRAGLRQLGAVTGCNAQDECPWRADPSRLPSGGGLMNCARCLRAGRHRLLCGVSTDLGESGALLVDFPRPPRQAQRDRLRDVGLLLGDTLQALAGERRRQRRELAAERAMLSRELHDTVAQQLSYLQIRASRIQALLATSEQPCAAKPMLDELRATLQLLHRQVRELIASARLTMDGRTLNEAVQASVDEFARCSSCVFELDNRIPAGLITPEAELQVLQIIREALANVVRHSHARRVQVSLLARPGGVEVRVEDDGIGLPDELPETGHFGLRIMRERAAGIDARLEFGKGTPRGTCVRLLWRGA